MGNETSSMKIHSLLTAEDLKALRSGFPGGATSATPITNLDWGAWKGAWPENRRESLEKLVKNGSNEVSFQAYQELAGRFVRGTTEERTKLIFSINNNAQLIKASQLLGKKMVQKWSKNGLKMTQKRSEKGSNYPKIGLKWSKNGSKKGSRKGPKNGQ